MWYKNNHMSQMLRVFMTILLSLTLMLGQGFFAVSEASKACCQEILAFSSSNCCSQQLTTIKAQYKSSKSCICGHLDQFSICQGHHLQLDLKSTLAVAHTAHPAKNLQLTDSGDPIWLYWHFHPDRSRLYQEKNSWLL